MSAHREEFMVPGMSQPVSHFTHVVRAGRIVFVSGCVATDGQGRLVGGNDNVADRERVNTVRTEYFGAHRPASTLVEISRLVRDEYLIEIEAIAVLPERRSAPSRAKTKARPRPARRRRK